MSGPIIKKNNKWKREERKLTKEILFIFSFLQKKGQKRHTHTQVEKTKNEIRHKGEQRYFAKRTDGNDPIVLQPRRCMSRHRITDIEEARLVIKERKKRHNNVGYRRENDNMISS